MLKELIDQYYVDSRDEREQTKFYITDAGKCPRAIYFKFKNVPREDMEPRIFRVFEHGDHVHLRIMAVLFGLGLVRAAEIGIPKQKIISGRADAIIALDNRLYVVEIKSITHYKFDKLAAPEPDHVKQIQLYMHYFKIPQGILLYECKDSQHIKEFLVKYDSKLVQELLDFFEELRELIRKNIIPAKPEKLEAWRCKYCPYKASCKQVETQAKNPSLKKTRFL